MREVRAVALSLLALVGAVAVAAPAPVAGPGPAAGAGADAPAATAPTRANNSSMGGQVSSFMQSSTGRTGEEVQSGMWNAAYENASDKSAVVQRRTRDIESRLAELQQHKQALQRAKANGSMGQAEYEARMSRVIGRLAALNRSIDETETQARASGADVAAVQRLARQASNLSGPEVAAVARTLPGGPPEDVPGVDRRGPNNGTDRGPGGDGQGQGEGGGQGQGEGGGQGQGNGQGEGGGQEGGTGNGGGSQGGGGQGGGEGGGQGKGSGDG